MVASSRTISLTPTISLLKERGESRTTANRSVEFLPSLQIDGVDETLSMTGFSQRGRQTTGTVKTATGGRTTIHTNFGIWQELFDDNNSPTRPVGISPSLISFQQPDETSEGQLVTIRNNTNQRMTCVWNSYTQSPTGKLPKCAQNSPFIVTPTTSDCDAHSTTSFRIKFLSLPTEGYTNQKGVIMKRWYEDEIFLNALNESPEEIRRTSGRSLSDQLFLSKRPTRQSEVRLN